MATQELDSDVERPAAAPDLYISRQPVVDGEMRVCGYRVAYSTADGSEPGDASAARLLGDVLSGVGLDELVGEALAHLPLSREVLLALGVPPVRPDRVMLRIAYDVALDPEVAPTIEALTVRGLCALALRPAGPRVRRLAARAVRDGRDRLHGGLGLRRGGAGRAADPGRPGHARWPPAWATTTSSRQAKMLGFQLFAGPFYASRHKAAGPQGAGRRDGHAGLAGRDAERIGHDRGARGGDRPRRRSERQAAALHQLRLHRHAGQHHLDPAGGDDARIARSVALGAAGRPDRRPEHAPGALGGGADPRAHVRAARLRSQRRGAATSCSRSACCRWPTRCSKSRRDDRRRAAAGRRGAARRCSGATDPPARSSTQWSATSRATSTPPASSRTAPAIATSYRDALGWAVQTVSSVN